MHRTVVLLLVVVLGAVSLAACEVRPQLELTITVGTDAVDADPGDGVCESTAGAGDCTLRAAVGEANALTAATIGPKPAITARLTTDVTLGISGGLEDANQTGDLDVDLGGGGWLTIDGGGHVLDGADLDRQVDLVSGRLDIVGLTLTGGLASESGGAIVTRSGTSLVVDGSTFTGNRSVSKSNCIYTSPNPPSSCSVWMGGGGGAIRSFGAVVITGSTFDGNVAAPIANGCTSAFPPRRSAAPRGAAPFWPQVRSPSSTAPSMATSAGAPPRVRREAERSRRPEGRSSCSPPSPTTERIAPARSWARRCVRRSSWIRPAPLRS